MKTFDANDPNWTAFALGELAAAEAAEYEQVLASDEDAQAFVGEIRAMAALLETQLEAEPMPELTAEHRAAIESAPEKKSAKVIPFRWIVAGGSAFAAAAILMIAVGLPLMTHKADPAAKDPTMSAARPSEESQGEPEETPDWAQQASADEQPDDDGIVDQEAPAVPMAAAIEEQKPADANSNRLERRDGAVTTLLPKRAQKGAKGRDSSGRNTVDLRGMKRADGDDKNGRFGFRQDPWGVESPGKQQGLIGNAGKMGWSGEEAPAAGEDYAPIEENNWKVAQTEPLSTFSVDVDTASYANVRRMLMAGQRPPADAVRIEELINYFDYDYPQPTADDPFAVATEVAPSPWNAGRKLVRVGLQGKDIDRGQRPASNLVFLIDVSGSMSADSKLGLLKRGLGLLVENLGSKDRVAIVVYAGASGMVLPSTPGNRTGDIMGALERLQAGGSTNGGAGIELAYDVARRNFIRGGTNRVILCTDGDFNVGVTNRQGLVQLATQKAKSGVFLTVLGLGMGNYKDATLEQIANKANGAYFYLDNDREARKVLVDELSGTLVTIAKDVKIQVEFNPARVAQYRLVGYENRKLAHRDFNDDKKDAGEIGAGHTVTALYEIVPVGAVGAGVDPLRYQRPPNELTPEAGGAELLTLKLRYKRPDGDRSKLLVFRVEDNDKTLDEASDELKFAAAVAGFGMLLRRSPHAGDLDWGTVLEWADVGRRNRDPQLLRKEFVQLVRRAQALP